MKRCPSCGKDFVPPRTDGGSWLCGSHTGTGCNAILAIRAGEVVILARNLRIKGRGPEPEPEPFFVITTNELWHIAKAADELEEMLHSGTGTTADWSFKITTDNTADAERLCSKLQALRAALVPFRRRKG